MLLAVAALVLVACGGGGDELRWDAQDVDPEEVREQARDQGMLAACGDGTFDQNSSLTDVCDGREEVLGWLYPFAECQDGSYVVLTGADDPSCGDRDGFRRAVDSPTPASDDVALCNDGLFDNEHDLAENCKRQGGIDEFLATYAECNNGRVILMTTDGIGCEDGIAQLLPDDYEPTPGPDDVALCNDGLFDNEHDLAENCKKQGGIDEFLATYAECNNGRIILMTTDGIGCEDGIARLLPADFEPEATPASDDVALCNDGLFDNEYDLAENCKRQGGIDEFLATYAECNNGRVILMTTDGIGCEDGIAQLLPDDYEPTPGPDDVALCNDGLFDNEHDLAENCKKQGGIDEFLATYAECGNGEIVQLSEEAECEGGLTLLPDDFVPPSTTTTTTTDPRSMCIPVSDDQLAQTIGLGLTVAGGGYLTDGFAVVAPPDSQLSTGWPVVYVGATIRGGGLGDDTVGTWAVGFDEATESITGPIFPASFMAQEFSDWGSAASPGSDAANMMSFLRESDAAGLAERCVD